MTFRQFLAEQTCQWLDFLAWTGELAITGVVWCVKAVVYALGWAWYVVSGN